MIYQPPYDVTVEVKDILAVGGRATTIGYFCVQGTNRICSGCTTACDQSVILIFPQDLLDDSKEMV